MVGIPTRGIDLAEVLQKKLSSKTGANIRKGIIDPTFYRDDQNRVGTRLIKATDIPIPIEKQEIILIDDVIYTGRTIRAAMDALYSWGRPQRVMLKKSVNLSSPILDLLFTTIFSGSLSHFIVSSSL